MTEVRAVSNVRLGPTGHGADPGWLSPSLRARLTTLGAFLLVAALASAAWAQDSYFIQADTVRGAIGAQGAVCVGNTVFMKGEQIVFRAYVYDAATGVALTTDDVAARGVKAYGVLDGQRVTELRLEAHPPGAPQTEVYWAGGWSVPSDHPTGNYGWSVEVEDAAGNVAAYLPMGHSVGLGTLMILEPAASSADLGSASTDTTFRAATTAEMDAN